MKKKENNERRNEVEKTLLELSGLEEKELFSKYQTDVEGLDPVQVSDRLEEYGRNIIDFGKEKSLAVRIKDAIINPFNIVLLVVAAITFVTDVVMADEPSFATFIMLVAVIIISATISFVQEEKSNSAAKKLQGINTADALNTCGNRDYSPYRIYRSVNYLQSADNASYLYGMARCLDGCLHDLCTDHESNIH